MDPKKPQYDFSHKILKDMVYYRRFAKEHLALAELQSDVIRWEVIETETPLKIPTKYHVHYFIKSITAIDDQEEPIYGSHHIMELSLPPRYPLEACKMYMITDVWHPNIRSDGGQKGRICGNLKNFGRSFDLYQLVLRIGEILQYKNYHAEHTPPFPEDSKVAYWVKNHAEPNEIVNKVKGIFIDDSPLVRSEIEQETVAHIPGGQSIDKKELVPVLAGDDPEDGPDESTAGAVQEELGTEEDDARPFRIRIGQKRANPKPKPPRKLSIKRRNDDS